jgi:nucleotide-binding universal stress UspA family protein
LSESTAQTVRAQPSTRPSRRRGFHHATLRAVHAWAIVPLTVPPFGEAAGVFPTPEDIQLLRDAGEKLLDDAVEQALREAKDGPTVERTLAQAHHAEALLAEAEDADLLVVGSRGLGGFQRSTARLRQPAGCTSRSLPGRHRP